MLDHLLDPDMPSRFSRRDFDETDVDGWNDPDLDELGDLDELAEHITKEWYEEPQESEA